MPRRKKADPYTIPAGVSNANDQPEETDTEESEMAVEIPQISASEEHALSERVKEARVSLLLEFPFLGYLASNLDDSFSYEVSTAGTDGKGIVWSPRFTKTLNRNDLRFVLAHEAMHCALGHVWRRGNRNPSGWNIAVDMCANDILLDSGLEWNGPIPLLKGAQGKFAEQVYAELKVQPSGAAGKGKGGGKDGKGQRGPGNPGDGPADGTLDDHGGWEKDQSEPENRALSDMWKAALKTAKQFGKTPGSLQRVIENMEPKRDWRDLLRDGLTFPEDYYWTPTDRRFSGVLLPTLRGEIHRVVIAIDTSGSIQGEKLGAFWSELLAILRNNRCEARVLTCDAEIQNEFDENTFHPGAVSKVRGGGGTSFVPVFKKVEQYATSGWIPEAVVYLTDLYGEFPQHAPDLRTVWVVEACDNPKQPPFGELVVLED